jgi:glycosyltransferase involved in cell wall biosynthesis
MPTISVIVPVYKVEQYLHQCIDSILAQTFTDFELILIDDGSPDNCGAICDEYTKQDARIKVIHQENGGLSAARNAGIDIAKGEYLTFIDSDDLIKDIYLEKLLLSLTDNDTDISICGMLSFDDGTKPQETDEQITDYPIIMNGRDACLSVYQMDGKVPIMAWGKLYKTNLFNTIRYPLGMIHEDDATTPKLFYRSPRINIISDKLYFYRSRTDSITSKPFSAKRFDGVRAVQLCIDYFIEAGDSQIVMLARTAKKVMQAKTVIRAYENNNAEQIPSNYFMSKFQALRYIRKFCSYDTFCWYLSLVYPKLVKPYSYLHKVKKVFGVKEK